MNYETALSIHNLPDDKLKQLGRLASKQLVLAAETWDFVLRQTHMRLNTREYRAICAAGRTAERSYRYLWLLAAGRGWTSEQLNEVFTVHTSYGWH